MLEEDDPGPPVAALDRLRDTLEEKLLELTPKPFVDIQFTRDRDRT